MPANTPGPTPAQPEREAVRRSILALIRRGDRLSAETLEAYERARRELLGMILAGEESELTIARYRLLIDQIDVRLDRLTLELTAKSKDALTETVHIEAAAAARELEDLLGQRTFLALEMGPALPSGMVHQMVTDGARLVKAPVVQLKDDIRRELTQSMIRGESVQKAAKRILSNTELTLDGLKKPVFRTAKERAEVIARTELSKAANGSHLDQYKRFAGRLPTLVSEWSSSHCARMCTRCQNMDGEQVKPGDNFPCGVPAPPLHPRCRCRIVAVVLSEEQYKAKFG